MRRLETISSLQTRATLGVSGHQARSFATLAFTFIVLLMLDLAASWGALEVVNGTRAYAVGEGRYSEAQKIAVFSLARFIDSRSESDYSAFQTAAAVPLGDRDARIALQTEPFDPKAASAGFLRGQNNRDDIGSLMRLFRYFSWWKPFAAAVADWTENDRLVDSLVQIAASIKSENVSDAVTRASERAMIGHIDDQLTRREDAF